MLRSAAALFFACSLLSAGWAAGPGAPPKDAAAHGAAKDKATGLDMRASELIGKHVVNPEGKSLGKIEDLIVDTKDEHNPHVVLSFGGFALPLSSLSVAGEEVTLKRR